VKWWNLLHNASEVQRYRITSYVSPGKSRKLDFYASDMDSLRRLDRLSQTLWDFHLCYISARFLPVMCPSHICRVRVRSLSSKSHQNFFRVESLVCKLESMSSQWKSDIFLCCFIYKHENGHTSLFLIAVIWLLKLKKFGRYKFESYIKKLRGKKC